MLGMTPEAALGGVRASAPWWGLTSSERPRSLPENGEGQIVLTAENLGGQPTKGEVGIRDALPAGLRATGIEALTQSAVGEGEASCVLASLSCTITGVVRPYHVIEVRISVQVQGARSGEYNSAVVSGGGAVPVKASEELTVGGPQRFGIERYSVIAENADGSIDAVAGSHPFQLTSVIALDTSVSAGGSLSLPAAPREIDSRLPAGLVAAPSAVSLCSQAQLTGTDGCPLGSVVGVASVTARSSGSGGGGIGTLTTPIYDLQPVPGRAASFGVRAFGVLISLQASTRSGGDYGVTIASQNITQAVSPISLRMTFWGVPSDPLHDGQRGAECLEGGSCTPPSQRSLRPLLTMPASCAEPFEATATATSWGTPEHPSEEAQPVTYTLPLPLGGCDSLPFTPSLAVNDSTTSASAPTGLSLDVHMPQEAGSTPEGVVESPLRNLTLALPEGIALNPAATSWLQGCSEPQIGFVGPEAGGGQLFAPTKPEPFCPGASKIGGVSIRSPLLKHPLTGGLYLASPTENPFSGLVSLYALAEEPEAGTVVKLAGEVKLNPNDGNVTVRFKNLPQLPFEDLSLELAEGLRAPFMTPSRCGTYAGQATLTPWSGNAAVTLPISVKVASGPSGTPCTSTLPFAPSLQAGMESNQAGSASTLTAQLSRQDGEQPLGGLTIVTPPGLAPDLAGVTPCEEPQAALGDCGPASQIGTVSLALGAGPQPAWIGLAREDPVYLTGPYEGAPFGLAIDIHPVTGPFDLSEGGAPIVIRAKVEVDPRTAQLRIVTGSLPTILKGVPLAIKQLDLHIDRSGFLLNPTDCEPMSIYGSVSSPEGGDAPISSRYQAAGCAGLAVKQRLFARTRGNGRLEGHGADLRLRLEARAGGANLRRLRIVLPKRLVARLQTIQRACKEGVFDAGPSGCPKASLVGHASVVTPLLPALSSPGAATGASMRGAAYLVAKSGLAAKRNGFPNLVLVLKGDGITIDLTGAVYVSAKNVTSVTFNGLPDIPIRRLTLSLPEGKRSLLSAGGSLCKRRGRLRVRSVARGQNGAVSRRSVRVRVSGCEGRRRHRRHRGGRRSKGRRH